MAVMSFTDFEQRTSKTSYALRARGTNLSKVDKVLKSYHAKAPTALRDGRIKLLSTLVSGCERWLKDKAVGTGVGSELFQRRRQTIMELGKQALADLLALDPDLLADVSFSTNKLDKLGTGAMPQTKALEGGYALEREDYLKSGKKQFPVSGSKVHVAHSNLNAFAPREQGLKAKRFEELTLADFQKINRLAAQEELAGRVDFLAKADRKAFIAIPTGGMFVDSGGANVNAPNPPSAGGRWPYAMDEYGNFYTKPEGTTRADMFNHSSFNAGKSVVSAGMVKILNGRLLWIDNSSGHYKPGKQNLHNALRLLAQEGIDIARAGVGFYEFTTGMQRVFFYKASNFLHDINYEFSTLLADDNAIYDVLGRLSGNAMW